MPQRPRELLGGARGLVHFSPPPPSSFSPRAPRAHLLNGGARDDLPVEIAAAIPGAENGRMDADGRSDRSAGRGRRKSLRWEDGGGGGCGARAVNAILTSTDADGRTNERRGSERARHGHGVFEWIVLSLTRTSH